MAVVSLHAELALKPRVLIVLLHAYGSAFVDGRIVGWYLISLGNSRSYQVVVQRLFVP